YHRLLKKSGEAVARKLQQACDFPLAFRVVVDSAPILERALAANSGAGFIGKNTCFIHPKLGSFLLLGEILVTSSVFLETSPSTQPVVGCGDCDRCQKCCPTGALDEAYKLDPARCLSYWTI